MSIWPRINADLERRLDIRHLDYLGLLVGGTALVLVLVADGDGTLFVLGCTTTALSVGHLLQRHLKKRRLRNAP